MGLILTLGIVDDATTDCNKHRKLICHRDNDPTMHAES